MGKHEAMEIDTVAELLGVSERQVRNYVKAGMPSRKEGRTPLFVWADARDWWADNVRAALPGATAYADTEDDDPDQPAPKDDIRKVTLRKVRADADLKELALSKLRGEVITIADAKVRLERMLGNLRAALLGMAPKLSSRLEGLRDRTAREAVIKEEMEALCREISTGAIVEVSEDAPEAETIDTLQASAAEPDPLDLLLTPDEYLDLTLELAERYAAALQ